MWEVKDFVCCFPLSSHCGLCDRLKTWSSVVSFFWFSSTIHYHDVYSKYLFLARFDVMYLFVFLCFLFWNVITFGFIYYLLLVVSFYALLVSFCRYINLSCLYFSLCLSLCTSACLSIFLFLSLCICLSACLSFNFYLSRAHY